MDPKMTSILAFYYLYSNLYKHHIFSSPITNLHLFQAIIDQRLCVRCQYLLIAADFPLQSDSTATRTACLHTVACTDLRRGGEKMCYKGTIVDLGWGVDWAGCLFWSVSARGWRYCKHIISHFFLFEISRFSILS